MNQERNAQIRKMPMKDIELNFTIEDDTDGNLNLKSYLYERSIGTSLNKIDQKYNLPKGTARRLSRREVMKKAEEEFSKEVMRSAKINVSRLKNELYEFTQEMKEDYKNLPPRESANIAGHIVSGHKALLEVEVKQEQLNIRREEIENKKGSLDMGKIVEVIQGNAEEVSKEQESNTDIKVNKRIMEIELQNRD